MIIAQSMLLLPDFPCLGFHILTPYSRSFNIDLKCEYVLFFPSKYTIHTSTVLLTNFLCQLNFAALTIPMKHIKRSYFFVNKL